MLWELVLALLPFFRGFSRSGKTDSGAGGGGAGVGLRCGGSRRNFFLPDREKRWLWALVLGFTACLFSAALAAMEKRTAEPEAEEQAWACVAEMPGAIFFCLTGERWLWELVVALLPFFRGFRRSGKTDSGGEGGGAGVSLRCGGLDAGSCYPVFE